MKRAADMEAVRTARRASALVLAPLFLWYAYSAFHRYLVNDDYLALYSGWLRSQGKIEGQDYSDAAVFLLPELLRPLFALLGETLDVAFAMRIALAVLVMVTALSLARVTRVVAGDGAAWFAPIVVASSAGMLHRGIDLRPDLVTTLLAAALLLLPFSTVTERQRWWGTGFLLGIAYVNVIKGGIVLPGVAIVVACRIYDDHASWGLRARAAARCVVGIVGGGAAVLAAFAVFLAATGELQSYLHNQLFALGSLSDYHEANRTAVTVATLAASLRCDSIFWACALAGLLLRVFSVRTAGRRSNAMSLALLAVAASSIAVNPVYYSYNLVTLQTLLAPFVATAFGRLIGFLSRHLHSARAVRFVVVGSVLLMPMAQIGVIAHYLEVSTIDHQLALHRMLMAHTRPDQAVFAFEGVGLFRPSTFHWRIVGNNVQYYQRGGFSLEEELRIAKPVVIVLSYRVPAWLTSTDQSFLENHYLAFAPNLAAPGHAFKPGRDEQEFELLVGGDYRVIPGSHGLCEIDGRQFEASDQLMLAKGRHRARATGNHCVLLWAFPESALELVRNPRRAPYLVPPILDILSPKAGDPVQ